MSAPFPEKPPILRRGVTIIRDFNDKLISIKLCDGCHKNIDFSNLESTGNWHKCRLYFYCATCVDDGKCPCNCRAGSSV